MAKNHFLEHPAIELKGARVSDTHNDFASSVETHDANCPRAESLKAKFRRRRAGQRGTEAANRSIVDATAAATQSNRLPRVMSLEWPWTDHG